jgi:hypothetical protein
LQQAPGQQLFFADAKVGPKVRVERATTVTMIRTIFFIAILLEI